MPTSHDVELISDLASFRDLRGAWDKLVPPQQAEPWQSFSWILACADGDRKIQSFHVVTVRKCGTLTAIAPLVLRQSSQPLSPMRLDFLGGEDLKEPNQFVYSSYESLELLVDSVASERVYPIRLSRIPSDPKVINLVRSKFKGHGWITRTMSVPYPYLDLNKGDNLIKRSLKEDLRRARRKAARRGEVTSDVADVTSSEKLHRHLRSAFRIEASGWKGRNQTAILCSESRKTFFESLASSAASEGTLRLVFLKIGGEDSAVQYSIESRNEYWLLNIGYHDDFKEFSPGNLLLEETIKAAAMNGLTRYNFLGKEEPWTRRWTSRARDCVVFAAYRPNVFGVKAILSDALYLYRKRRQDRIAQQIRRGQILEARSPESA